MSDSLRGFVSEPHALRGLTSHDSLLAPPKPAKGLTPPELDANVHVERCLAQLRSKDKDIEKNIYLSQLKDADTNMFYKLCLTHMSEFTPLMYVVLHASA